MDAWTQLADKRQTRGSFETIEQANATRLAEMIALQRIGRKLNSTFDMDQILSLLIHDVVNVTPATHGSVLLFDRETGSLSPRAWCGLAAEQIEAFKNQNTRSERGIVYRVFRTGRTTITDDVRLAPDYLEVVPTTRSELTVPIRYGQEIVGVIDLESPQPGAFGFDNQRFVEAIAEQAAIAIGNAQRYAEQVERENGARQRNEQLRDLIAISHELHAEHTLNDVLDQIVQAIPATGGFRVAMLTLVEGDPPVTRRVAAAGITLEELEALQQVRQPFSAYDHVWQEQYRISRSYFLPHERGQDWERGIHIYTVLKETDSWQKGDWHPNDVLLVPLRDSKGQMLGWLSVDDPFDGRMPTRETIEVLELFANEAASAIENARLYDELELRVRGRTEELARALEWQAVEVERTRAIVESISDAVLVFDAGGKVILANTATARVLGVAPESIVGRSIDETSLCDLSPKDQEMIGVLFRNSRTARESLSQGQDLVSAVFRAARRVVQVNFSPVCLRAGDPLTMVAVFRDITAEAELDRMKSELISMVAHELRTPMTSITGYVDLLMLGMLGPVTDKQSEFLQVVKGNASRLLTLANDLLDVSKIESDGLKLNLEHISAADMVDEAVLALEKQIQEKGQTVLVQVPRDLPKVTADRDRMVQVFTNLISNAKKYSPRGSQIEIRGRRVNGHLEIAVKDSGIGIAPEDKKRLFTRFFRASNAVSTEEDGTGLGLAICLEIVERHGGEIQVDSVLGKGSTFRILLPFENGSTQDNACTEDPR